ARLLAITLENGFRRNDQMDTGVLDTLQRIDGARELPLQGALVLHSLVFLGEAVVLVIVELEADTTAQGHSAREEGEPGVVHLRRGHLDRSAVLGEAVRHLLLLELRDDTRRI